MFLLNLGNTDDAFFAKSSYSGGGSRRVQDEMIVVRHVGAGRNNNDDNYVTGPYVTSESQLIHRSSSVNPVTHMEQVFVD